MNSETPRTDAWTCEINLADGPVRIVHASDCKTLERELTALASRLAAAEKQRDEAVKALDAVSAMLLKEMEPCENEGAPLIPDIVTEMYGPVESALQRIAAMGDGQLSNRITS